MHLYIIILLHFVSSVGKPNGLQLRVIYSEYCCYLCNEPTPTGKRIHEQWMYCKRCAIPWCCHHAKDFWIEPLKNIKYEDVWKNLSDEDKVGQLCKLCLDPRKEHNNVKWNPLTGDYLDSNHLRRSPNVLDDKGDDQQMERWKKNSEMMPGDWGYLKLTHGTNFTWNEMTSLKMGQRNIEDLMENGQFQLFYRKHPFGTIKPIFDQNGDISNLQISAEVRSDSAIVDSQEIDNEGQEDISPSIYDETETDQVMKNENDTMSTIFRDASDYSSRPSQTQPQQPQTQPHSSYQHSSQPQQPPSYPRHHNQLWNQTAALYSSTHLNQTPRSYTTQNDSNTNQNDSNTNQNTDQ